MKRSPCLQYLVSCAAVRSYLRELLYRSLGVLPNSRKYLVARQRAKEALLRLDSGF